MTRKKDISAPLTFSFASAALLEGFNYLPSKSAFYFTFYRNKIKAELDEVKAPVPVD